jgi:hypothetical protein
MIWILEDCSPSSFVAGSLSFSCCSFAMRSCNSLIIIRSDDVSVGPGAPGGVSLCVGVVGFVASADACLGVLMRFGSSLEGTSGEIRGFLEPGLA